MNSAQARRILVMVCILHAATHMYTVFLAPLNGDLKAFFGLTLDSDVTFFFTLYLVCYAASNLLSGFLCGRVQSRTLLAVGPFVNGLSIASLYLLTPQHYGAMAVLIALGALGGGLYHPVANMLLTRAFPDSKGRALGIVGIGASFAFVAAPWTASVLVHKDICTWQTVCLIYGAIGVVSGIGAWLFVPPDSAYGPVLAAYDTDAASPSPSGAVAWFTAFMVLVIAGREIASWGTTAVTQQFIRKAPEYAVDPGLLVGLVFMPGIIVQPLAGKWSDTLGRERVLAAGIFGIALALWLIPHTPPALIMLPYIFMGIAMTATVPTSEALLAERCPVHLRGRVFGFTITAGIALGALGPKLAGAIADAGERSLGAYRNAFFALSGVTLFSAMLAVFLKPVARALNVERFGQSAQRSLASQPSPLTPAVNADAGS